MSKLIKSGHNIELSDNEKHEMQLNAQKAYGEFLTALGYDWEDDTNMAETPRRVAKMMVNEIGHGSYSKPPKVTTFDNDTHYDGMVFEGNIDVKSFCSHHIMPFLGKAHVAYIPDKNGKICGLSKLNRVVDWHARRPQLQENLTIQIHNFLEELLPDNQGIAVIIEATHTCVAARGVNQNSIMKTSKLSGAFQDRDATRDEFYRFINDLK